MKFPFEKDPFLGGHDNFLGSTSTWPSPLTASAPTAPTLPCCASSRSFCEGTKTKTMCRWPLSSTGSLGATEGPQLTERRRILYLKGFWKCVFSYTLRPFCLHSQPEIIQKKHLISFMLKPIPDFSLQCFKWGSWGRLSVKHPHPRCSILIKQKILKFAIEEGSHTPKDLRCCCSCRQRCRFSHWVWLKNTPPPELRRWIIRIRFIIASY